MIQIVSKKHQVINYKELICLQQTKVLQLTTKKKDCYMNGKKIWKSLRQKTTLKKTCSLFRQEYSELGRNVAGDSFSNSFSTCIG